MDVAALGVSVKSTGVDKATTDLNKLSVAAAAAEANAKKLEKQRFGAEQTNTAARAATNLAKANEQAARATGTLTAEERKALQAARQTAAAHELNTRALLNRAKAADLVARAEARAAAQALRDQQQNNPNPRNPAANDNGPQRHNVSNIAAQFQDIGVTAAMGMNPLLIALQQGTQLSMALEGGLKGLLGALRLVFGATALLTIGIVALVAGLIQLVNWTKVAQYVLNFIADILPKVAVGIALVGTAIAIAFAPAALTLFWNLFLTITAGIIAGAASIIAAIGAIPIAIGLIVADLYIFRDEWAKVLGFDLIGVVKKGVNLIIGSFVAAYHDIEFLWKNFPNVIGAAAIGAANLVIKAVNFMVTGVINQLNGIVKIINGIGSIGDKIGIGGFKIDEVNAGDYQFNEMANTAADKLAGAVGARNEQLQKDLSKDYLSAMGGAINDAADWASGKIREFSKGLGEDKKKKKSGGKTDEEKYEDIVKGAERRIAMFEAEGKAIGLTEEAAAALRYEQELLNQAQQKGIDLSPTQRANLQALAGAMASAEEQVRKLQEAYDFAKDLTKGFASDLKNSLVEGKGLWESFGNAALNVLDKITDKLLNEVIDALFQVNKAGAGGGAGGGFFGLISQGLSWLFNAKGNAFGRGGVQAFANGGSFTNSVVSKATPFAYGGSNLGVMGEKDPEAIMPLSRDSRGRLGVTTIDGGKGGNGGSGGVIVGAIDVFVNEDGAWEAKVRSIAVEESTQVSSDAIDLYTKRSLPDAIEKHNQNPYRRG